MVRIKEGPLVSNCKLNLIEADLRRLSGGVYCTMYDPVSDDIEGPIKIADFKLGNNIDCGADCTQRKD